MDKACDPRETVRLIQAKLASTGTTLYAGSRRIDTGRLGIPVFLSICGTEARKIMPVRKQMGKGSSSAQAEASALMEFMERFSYFSFWQNPGSAIRATWQEAERLFGSALLPIDQMLLSVRDLLPIEPAREILNLAEWTFLPATDLATGELVWLPGDWFRMLSEFNGSSAGNTNEESLLQGLSELIERHVCAIVDRERPQLPTINPANATDPALRRLLDAFTRNNIHLVLKDVSLGMPLPTVAAIAWDDATFPDQSEIVFTAGTATSPEKAAIRAITEVAQLAGDFCTNSSYEASGLPKFDTIDDMGWLLQGPEVSLSALPDRQSDDIYQELQATITALAPVRIYALQTTHPQLDVPAHYCIAPGLEFRERDKNQSLGLFVGRKLIEEATPEQARTGLATIATHYPGAHFLPFFSAQLALTDGNYTDAANLFAEAISAQPDADSRALAAFYAGYAHSQDGAWADAMPWLESALRDNPAMKEAANLLGVANFRLGHYPEAERCFNLALKLDKGSAMDLANRGMARKLMGRKAEALHDLAAALELQPDLDFAAKALQELLRDE